MSQDPAQSSPAPQAAAPETTFANPEDRIVDPSEARPPRSSVGTILTVLLGLLVGSALSYPAWSNWQDRLRLSQIQAASPELQRHGAWHAADEGVIDAIPLLIQLLDAELEPFVRESFVYNLGRFGDPQAADALVIEVDRSKPGVIRAASWLALARCDHERFTRLVTTRSAETLTDWDRLGISQGRAAAHLLTANDVRILLSLAGATEHDLQTVARRALRRQIAPLLLAAGRWPVGTAVLTEEDSRQWTAEDLRTIEAALPGLELGRISRSLATLTEDDRVRYVRRNQGKILRARNRIADAIQQF